MAHLSILVLVTALSLDSFGVGAAYGLRRIRLPWSFYVIVTLCTGLLMGLSMGAGGHLSRYLDPSLARRVGGAVLTGVGMWQLYQGWQGYRRHLAPVKTPKQVLRLGIRSLGLIVQILVEPAAADQDRSGHIDAPEALALGLALGLDSLGGGLGAAMVGYPLTVVPLVGLGCAAFAGLGLGLGRLPATERLLRRAYALPGLLLMALGLLRLR